MNEQRDEYAEHLPDEPCTISLSTGLVYCKRCGRLLSSDKSGPTRNATEPCRPARVSLRRSAYLD